ncbi:MAG TPA: hypothetical protein VI248_09360 [Kineosporiaceae bacterium]
MNAALREVSQRFLRLRALEQLTERGAHRSAGTVDLLIAATAERSELIILCDDRGYETVSSVTGQPVRRVTSW